MWNNSTIELKHGPMVVPQYDAGTIVALDRVTYIDEHSKSFSDREQVISAIVDAEQHKAKACHVRKERGKLGTYFARLRRA